MAGGVRTRLLLLVLVLLREAEAACVMDGCVSIYSQLPHPSITCITHGKSDESGKSTGSICSSSSSSSKNNNNNNLFTFHFVNQEN